MNQYQKQIETVEVRGICAAIQAMQMPTFENLNKVLNNFGYQLIKKEDHAGNKN